MKVSLLTGGHDKTYAFGLLLSLIQKGIEVDIIGSDELQDEIIIKQKYVSFYNFYGSDTSNAPITQKGIRVLKFYYNIIKYAFYTDSKLFHILWLNKFLFLDMTFLNIFYKILGKKIVFTAHNINIHERDGKNPLKNRVGLKLLYRIVDHIFVHTNTMKSQLINDFQINEKKITIIPFGINSYFPNTNITKQEARKKLSLAKNEKVLLFFGNIAPYKGIEYLIESLIYLKDEFKNIKLIIAGKIKNKDCIEYWGNLEKKIKNNDLEGYIRKDIQFIPDENVEIYFKASDVLILPYKHIFQSGVMFLSYNFGIPVIAMDVGSFKEEIVEEETGFICQPANIKDLVKTIKKYFESDLFKNYENHKNNIIEYANEKYSWEKVGKITHSIYKNLQ